MENAVHRNLVLLKIAHTLVWVFFNMVLFYLAYAAVVDKIDIWVWIGVGLVFCEGLVLLVFGNMRPLTVIARRYSDSDRDNFDIYLPNWLARHNKAIYTSFFAAICILLIIRMLTD